MGGSGLMDSDIPTKVLDKFRFSNTTISAIPDLFRHFSQIPIAMPFFTSHSVFRRIFRRKKSNSDVPKSPAPSLFIMFSEMHIE